MKSQIKSDSLQKLHKIVWIFVGVFGLIAVSYPIACLRIAQTTKFAGSHLKSLPMKPELATPIALQSVHPVHPKMVKVEPVKTTPIETKIRDADKLEMLNQMVYQQIDRAWQTWPTFTQNLVYLVSVNDQGSIEGCLPLNQSAKDYDQEIPLPTLMSAKKAVNQPLAELVVVFTPSGVLEVSPKPELPENLSNTHIR